MSLPHETIVKLRREFESVENEESLIGSFMDTEDREGKAGLAKELLRKKYIFLLSKNELDFNVFANGSSGQTTNRNAEYNANEYVVKEDWTVPFAFSYIFKRTESENIVKDFDLFLQRRKESGLMDSQMKKWYGLRSEDGTPFTYTGFQLFLTSSTWFICHCIAGVGCGLSLIVSFCHLVIRKVKSHFMVNLANVGKD